MDLFDKKLTWEEALHYDSMIDSGHYNPHFLLVSKMLQDDKYLPNQEQSSKIMDYIDKSAKMEQTNQTTQEPTKKMEPPIQKKEETDTTNKKNNTKRYIKLPNATIRKHKHKFKQVEIQKHNATTSNK